MSLDDKYPNELDPTAPTSGRVLYVQGPEVFAGPQLDEWTPDKILDVLRYRGPELGGTSCVTTAEFVVVPCPTVSYAQLNTPQFWAAWESFALQHRLCITVGLRATFDAIAPGVYNNLDMAHTHKQGFGTPGDGVLHLFVCFYTKEAREVDKSLDGNDFWGYMLGDELHLSAAPSLLPTILAAIPDSPEEVFGAPGSVFLASPALDPYTQIAVIRSGNNGPEARVFEVEYE